MRRMSCSDNAEPQTEKERKEERIDHVRVRVNHHSLIKKKKKQLPQMSHVCKRQKQVD